MSWTPGSKIVDTYQKDDTSAAVTGTCLAAVSAGDVVVVVVGFDNIYTGGSIADTTDVTVTDSKSNTYTRAKESQYGTTAQVRAGAGVFYSKLATGLTTSDTITATFNVSPPTTKCQAKVLLAQSFDISGDTISVAGSTSASANATVPPELTLGSLYNVEHLYIYGAGIEGEWTVTPDGDYTSIATTDTNEGGGTSEMTGHAEYRIYTGTGDTCTPVGGGGDTVGVFVALRESTASGTERAAEFGATADVAAWGAKQVTVEGSADVGATAAVTATGAIEGQTWLSDAKVIDTYEKSSTTAVISGTCLANVPAGRVLVVVVAFDNLYTGGSWADTTDVTVTDSQGNYYTRAREIQYGLTAWVRAGCGVFYSLITTALESGVDTVIANFSAIPQSKVLLAQSFSVSAGAPAVAASAANTANATTPPELTLSGLASGEYLLIYGAGIEGEWTVTPDGTYTTIATTDTNEGGGTSEMTGHAEFSIVGPVTGDTCTPTGGGGDTAAVLVALRAGTNETERAASVGGSAGIACTGYLDTEVPQDTWIMSGLDGGGGINCIAVSPVSPLLVAGGGDVTGMHVSTDGAVTWENRMRGMSKNWSGGVGGLYWSPTETERLWSAQKDGLWVSEDAGLNWDLCSATVVCGQTSTRPRENGHIIQDDGEGYVYVVDMVGKLYRWAYDTDTPTSGSLTMLTDTAEVGSGFVLDPLDSTTGYLSTRSGLYKVTSLRGTAARTKYSGTGTPTAVYEVAAVNEGGVVRLYCACYNEGIKRVGTSVTGDWTDITGTMGATRGWNSVDARWSGTWTYVAVAASVGEEVGDKTKTVFHSSDGHEAVPTWTCITFDDENCALVTTEGGDDGPEWWGYLPPDAGGESGNRLVYGSSPVMEQVHLDPSDLNRVFMAGQQGVYLADLNVKKLWPMMRGLGVTVCNDVFVDPNDSDYVYVTNVDHGFFASKSAGYHFVKRNGISPVRKDASVVTQEQGTTDRRLYAGFCELMDLPPTGGVWFNDDPINDFHDWVKMGTTPSGYAALGLAVRRVGSNVLALAHVVTIGICKATFSTATPPAVVSDWTLKSDSMPTSQQMNSTIMAWASDTIAYCFVRPYGLYITRDAGETWSEIWDITTAQAGEGFVTPDPDTPGTCYVSLGDAGSPSGARGVWRLTGCEVAGATVENAQITKSEITKPGSASFTDAGPITMAAGGLAAVDCVDGAFQALYAEAPDTGSVVMEDVSGTDFSQHVAYKVSSAFGGSSRRLYLAMRGPGVVIGGSYSVEPQAAISVGASASMSVSGVVEEAVVGPIPTGDAPTVPDLIVEVDFTSDPNPPGYSMPAPTWTNVTPYVREGGFTLFRGRRRSVDRVEAGNATLLLDNIDGRFDLANTDGPYYPYVVPFRRIRVQVVVSTETDPWYVGQTLVGGDEVLGGGPVTLTLISGYVQTWLQDYPERGFDATCTVRIVDMFGLLTQDDFYLPYLPYAYGGERFEQILNFAVYTGRTEEAGIQVAQSGWSSLGSPDRINTAFLSDYEHKADPSPNGFTLDQVQLTGPMGMLDALQTTAESEGALFFIARDGRPAYLHRNTPSIAQSPVPVFGVSGELFTDVVREDDESLIFNYVETSYAPNGGGTTVNEEDKTSIYRFGKRTYSLSTWLLSGDDASTRQHEFIRKYRSPRPFIRELNLSDVVTDWHNVLSRDLWDQVLLRVTMPNGDTYEQLSIIEGISIASTSSQRWEVKWQLSEQKVFTNLMTENQSSLESGTTAGWLAEQDCNVLAGRPEGMAGQYAYEGDYTLALMPTATVAPAVISAVTTLIPGVEEDLEYEFRGAFRRPVYSQGAPSAGNVPTALEIEWVNSSGDVISVTSSPFGNLGWSWTIRSLTGTAPTGATQVRLRITYVLYGTQQLCPLAYQNDPSMTWAYGYSSDGMSFTRT